MIYQHQFGQPPHAAPATHLDAPETPVGPELHSASPDEPEGPKPLAETFRHSGWAADRERTYEAMRDAGVTPSRLSAFAKCGSGHWILRHRDDDERFKIVPDHCHDRFCVPCARARQAIIRRNLLARLRRQPHRLLTLTIRHTDEPLRELLNRLYRGFRRLRQRRLWKERVTGGVALLELTYADPGDRAGSRRVVRRPGWHPHLHCILEGKYIDLQDLSRAWLAATGDSKSISIRLIRNTLTACSYVTKYATKPMPPCVTSRHWTFVEAIETLNGRRTLITFGRWRNWKLLTDDRDDSWELFDHIDAVHYRASLDDPLCENILAMLGTADPHSGEFYVHVESPALDC